MLNCLSVALNPMLGVMCLGPSTCIWRKLCNLWSMQGLVFIFGLNICLVKHFQMASMLTTLGPWHWSSDSRYPAVVFLWRIEVYKWAIQCQIVHVMSVHKSHIHGIRSSLLNKIPAIIGLVMSAACLISFMSSCNCCFCCCFFCHNIISMTYM